MTDDKLTKADDLRTAMSRAAYYSQSTITESTVKAYAAHFGMFRKWAEERGLAALPCEIPTVVCFLAAMADGTIEHTFTKNGKTYSRKAPYKHSYIRDALVAIRQPSRVDGARRKVIGHLHVPHPRSSERRQARHGEAVELSHVLSRHDGCHLRPVPEQRRLQTQGDPRHEDPGLALVFEGVAHRDAGRAYVRNSLRYLCLRVPGRGHSGPASQGPVYGGVHAPALSHVWARQPSCLVSPSTHTPVQASPWLPAKSDVCSQYPRLQHPVGQVSGLHVVSPSRVETGATGTEQPVRNRRIAVRMVMLVGRPRGGIGVITAAPRLA